jgi:hypothetical protein
VNVLLVPLRDELETGTTEELLPCVMLELLAMLDDEPLEEELPAIDELLPNTTEELLPCVVLELLAAFDEPLEELPPLDELELPLPDEDTAAKLELEPDSPTDELLGLFPPPSDEQERVKAKASPKAAASAIFVRGSKF